MPPNSIEAITERVRGALTGQCGERELKEHAFDDLEWLLEAYRELEEARDIDLSEAEVALSVAEESEASALRDLDKAEKRADTAEAECKRLLRLLSPPIEPVAS
jgi:chromosome segregation ATPase